MKYVNPSGLTHLAFLSHSRDPPSSPGLHEYQSVVTKMKISTLDAFEKTYYLNFVDRLHITFQWIRVITSTFPVFHTFLILTRATTFDRAISGNEIRFMHRAHAGVTQPIHWVCNAPWSGSTTRLTVSTHTLTFFRVTFRCCLG